MGAVVPENGLDLASHAPFMQECSNAPHAASKTTKNAPTFSGQSVVFNRSLDNTYELRSSWLIHVQNFADFPPLDGPTVERERHTCIPLDEPVDSADEAIELTVSINV